MHGPYTVSVIFPTYNEKDSIRRVIHEFERLGVVDEILVINNNAAPGTSDEVRGTSAREVFEPVQGYGRAIRRGFREATGDLLPSASPTARSTPGTCQVSRLRRRRRYRLRIADDQDVHLGPGEHGHSCKWGNWFVAKMMELLFNTSYLSDVGCTYRLIRRDALMQLLPTFIVNSNFFGPEMMVRGYLMKCRCVQIPVNYKGANGDQLRDRQSAEGDRLGFQMTILIIAMRFGLERWLLRLLR